MAEIESISTITSLLHLAKALHDVDRFDVVKKHFFDALDSDCYFENALEVLANLFEGFDTVCNEYDGHEIMFFGDKIISTYFTYAWEHGKRNKIPYTENPYVAQAQQAARNWLNVSHCSDWKLLGYTKTKKAAQKSRLLVLIDYNCGCFAQEHIAYGLVQLYGWFAEKCADFQKSEQSGYLAIAKSRPILIAGLDSNPDSKLNPSSNLSSNLNSKLTPNLTQAAEVAAA